MNRRQFLAGLMASTCVTPMPVLEPTRYSAAAASWRGMTEIGPMRAVILNDGWLRKVEDDALRPIYTALAKWGDGVAPRHLDHETDELRYGRMMLEAGRQCGKSVTLEQLRTVAAKLRAAPQLEYIEVNFDEATNHPEGDQHGATPT